MSPRRQVGATPGDVMIALAIVSLALALLYPAWTARGFRGTVVRAIDDVGAVASAARAVLDETGAWPTAAAPAAAPAELVGLSAPDGPFGRTEYRLQWTVWSVIDSAQAPGDVLFSPGDEPPSSAGTALRPHVRAVGGVAVHAPDPRLLAELAEHFDPQTSVLLDTTWVLLLPERGDARQP